MPNSAHLVSANSKRTSWLYGKENSWIRFSDDIAQHSAPFHGILTWCLRNPENGTKNFLKMSADFPFFQFSFVILLRHWYQHWVPSMFWNMLKSNQRHDACKVLQSPEPSSLKFDLKALMLLFRKLYKSFVGLEQFRYCGLKFKHPFLDGSKIFPVNLRLNKTRTSKVGAISKAKKRKTFFLRNTWNFRNFFSFGKCRTVPKNVKGTLCDLLTYIQLQNIKKNSKGEQFGDIKKFSKKVAQCRKNPKGDPLGTSGFVGFLEKVKKGPFTLIRFCRLRLQS